MAARHTVASPKLNGAPSPPTRPRTINSPLSAARSSSWLGVGPIDSRHRAISVALLSASTVIASYRRRLRSASPGEIFVSAFAIGELSMLLDNSVALDDEALVTPE